jgi:hypothetical protein
MWFIAILFSPLLITIVLCDVNDTSNAAASPTTIVSPTNESSRGPSNENNNLPNYTRIYPTVNPTTSGVLHGYDWIYYAFSMNSEEYEMIDLTLFLDKDAGQDNCKGYAVQVNLQTEPPPVEERTIAAKDTPFWPSVMETVVIMTQESILCETCSRVGLSEKQTSGNLTWWILVQTRGGDPHDAQNTTCSFNMDIKIRKYMPFVTIGGAVLGVVGLVVLAKMVSVMNVMLMTDFRVFPWNASLLLVLALVPQQLVYLMKGVARALLRWGARAVEWYRRHRAAAETERELITPAAARSDDALEGTEMAAVVVQPPTDGAATDSVTTPSSTGGETTPSVNAESEDPVACRICRDETSAEELIQPCNCTGTMAYVHRSCLDTWRSECLRRNPVNAARCEVCHAQFVISVQYNTVDVAQRLAAASLKQALDGFLFLIALWIVGVLSGYLATYALGSITCNAVWHSLRTTNFTEVQHYAVGMFFYSFVLAVLYNTTYVCWLLTINNTPQGTPALQTQAMSVAKASLFIFASAIWASYFLKFCLYVTNEFVVWDNEVGLITGFFVLTMMSTVVGLGVAAKVMATRAMRDYLVSQGLLREHVQTRPADVDTTDDTEDGSPHDEPLHVPNTHNNHNDVPLDLEAQNTPVEDMA